jgi:peptide/nickel transport system permease protein
LSQLSPLTQRPPQVGVAGSEFGDAEPDTDRLPSASQAKLVWRGFRKHRMAMAGAVVLLFLFLVAAFGEFLAPYGTRTVDDLGTWAPPQMLRVVERTDDGWDWGLHVYGYHRERDENLAVTYSVDRDQKIPVRLFAKGHEYRLMGLIPWDRHLIGPVDPDDSMFLLGSDRNGRDVMSRLIYATRVSMTVGLVGVALAFLLGVTLGALSGYFGGRVDAVIQRLVELSIAVPSIPLWLGLTAAISVHVGQITRYFLITIILAVIAWGGLAREVRGRFLAMRNEDFVVAARLDGSSGQRVMFRHMLPSMTSHLIAQLTLRIPEIILAETALSFLGLGLLPPTVSWGVMLNDATNIRSFDSPWLLLPGLAVVVTVLAFNFVGDGLRDAADPYRNN